MNYNCRITESIIGVVVLVLALLPTLLGTATKWVLVAAGAILIIHTWLCKNCGSCKNCGVPVSKPAPVSKPMTPMSSSSVPVTSKPMTPMSSSSVPVTSKPMTAPAKPSSSPKPARKPVRKATKKKVARRRR